jgi:hypothetical protein
MLSHPNLFWVNFEWEGHIPYRVVAADYQFYYYHSASSVAPLLAIAPPEDMTETVKRLLHERLSPASNYRLTQARGLVRKAARRLIGS